MPSYSLESIFLKKWISQLKKKKQAMYVYVGFFYFLQKKLSCFGNLDPMMLWKKHFVRINASQFQVFLFCHYHNYVCGLYIIMKTELFHLKKNKEESNDVFFNKIKSSISDYQNKCPMTPIKYHNSWGNSFFE